MALPPTPGDRRETRDEGRREGRETREGRDRERERGRGTWDDEWVEQQTRWCQSSESRSVGAVKKVQ